MNILTRLILVVCAGWAMSSTAEDICVSVPRPALTIPSFELRDQFNQPQRLSFPATNAQLVIVADRRGAGQIEGWVRPLKQQYGESLVIHGLADVRAVPALLRGRVRREFQAAQSYPVMLDWSGRVVNSFAVTANQANVCLLDRDGKVIARFTGPATPGQLEKLRALITPQLASAGAAAAATQATSPSSLKESNPLPP